MIENLYFWAYTLLTLSFVLTWYYQVKIKGIRISKQTTNFLWLIVGSYSLLVGVMSVRHFNDTIALIVACMALIIIVLIPSQIFAGLQRD